MNAERVVQPKFRLGGLAAGLLLLAAIAAFDRWLTIVPNRHDLGAHAVQLRFEPVAFDRKAFAPLRLAGAWRVTSGDPLFGGVSALAIDRGRLLALTDSGRLVRLRPASGAAEISELPDGPGSGSFKRNRDSEALLRDPGGRGWWVAFENRHELWLYDPGFRRAVQRIRLGERRWPVNRGVEGLAADGPDLLLFSESGRQALRLTGSVGRAIDVANSRGRISDVAGIGAGRFIAVERRLTPFGFRNALVMLDKAGPRYRFGRRIPLPLGALDNVEAITVEPLPGGGRRLWLMTDDNFQPPLRTLLIALDWPGPRQ